MKWLVVLSLCVMGCGNDAPPTIPGSGTAVPPGNIRGTGGAGGADGGGGAGGGGGTGGEPSGACDNESDLDAIDGAGDGLRDIARDCRLPNSPFLSCSLIFDSRLYEECISECVENEVPGLSAGCATCYGALERCGLDSFCAAPCQLNACSTICLDCMSLAGCITDFEECTGLPGDGCPDTSP